MNQVDVAISDLVNRSEEAIKMFVDLKTRMHKDREVMQDEVEKYS